MTNRFCMTLGLLAATCLAMPALAQNNDQSSQAGQSSQKNESSAVGQLDSVTQGSNVRASKLTGMNIQNSQGKSVGAINDLVIDVSSGKIRYAAVTYGGFLGIGNKMFAVPFEAFKFQRDQGGDTVLVLNVTQQQLEGAVGFDENNWPDFANQTFTMELDKRYGVDRDKLKDSESANRSGTETRTNR